MRFNGVGLNNIGVKALYQGLQLGNHPAIESPGFSKKMNWDRRFLCSLAQDIGIPCPSKYNQFHLDGRAF
jgi:hypothetical protein